MSVTLLQCSYVLPVVGRYACLWLACRPGTLVMPCNSLRVDTKQSTHYNALCAVHVAGPDRTARVRSGRLGMARPRERDLGSGWELGIGTLGTLGMGRGGPGRASEGVGGSRRGLGRRRGWQ